MVGSGNFTESNIIAEIYSQALAAKGLESSTKLGIGSREVYIKALQDKSISIVPEYTGQLLLNFDKSAKAKTPEEVEAALLAAVRVASQCTMKYVTARSSARRLLNRGFFEKLFIGEDGSVERANFTEPFAAILALVDRLRAAAEPGTTFAAGGCKCDAAEEDGNGP